MEPNRCPTPVGGRSPGARRVAGTGPLDRGPCVVQTGPLYVGGPSNGFGSQGQESAVDTSQTCTVIPVPQVVTEVGSQEIVPSVA